MRRVVLVVATMALAILLAGGVAQAIINGVPDRGPKSHPYVGAYVAKLGGKLLPVCSGTLISPKVFLTAGHCTEVEIEKDRPAYVSFDPTYKPGASEIIKGTPYLHPKACLMAKDCLAYPIGRYDVGVVVLKEPVRMATYGALPAAGLADTLKEGQRLTAVGYGASGFDRGGDGPLPQPVYPDTRYRGTVRLLNTKDPAVGDMYIKTTGVSLIKREGGGTCTGDSGGPLFLPDQQTIVGVTSFGYPLWCSGPGYFQRMDLPRVLNWVRSFP
jgi:Trypsin